MAALSESRSARAMVEPLALERVSRSEAASPQPRLPSGWASEPVPAGARTADSSRPLNWGSRFGRKPRGRCSDRRRPPATGSSLSPPLSFESCEYPTYPTGWESSAGPTSRSGNDPNVSDQFSTALFFPNPPFADTNYEPVWFLDVRRTPKWGMKIAESSRLADG